MMNVITVLTTILVATVTAQEGTLTLKYASLVSNFGSFNLVSSSSAWPKPHFSFMSGWEKGFIM